MVFLYLKVDGATVAASGTGTNPTGDVTVSFFTMSLNSIQTLALTYCQSDCGEIHMNEEIHMCFRLTYVDQQIVCSSADCVSHKRWIKNNPLWYMIQTIAQYNNRLWSFFKFVYITHANINSSNTEKEDVNMLCAQFMNTFCPATATACRSGKF